MGKSRFTVVCMENNTTYKNNTSVTVFCILTAINLLMSHPVFRYFLSFDKFPFHFFNGFLYNAEDS